MIISLHNIVLELILKFRYEYQKSLSVLYKITRSFLFTNFAYIKGHIEILYIFGKYYFI